MTDTLTRQQSNLLRTIQRHGGSRLSTAVDRRLSKALVSKGLLSYAVEGYVSLTETAREYLAQEEWSFQGHTYIEIDGDALTPARMWTVRLYTDAEFQQLPASRQAEVRRLLNSDQGLVRMHFHA